MIDVPMLAGAAVFILLTVLLAQRSPRRAPKPATEPPPLVAHTGEPVPFFPFGPSTKANAYKPAGYDGVKDEVNAGGGVWISTKNDSPNIWGLRQETQDTATGFEGNNTLFRIGAVPIRKDGVPLLDFNHSDDEAANIAFKIYVADNGNDPTRIYSEILFQVISNRDPTHTPFPVLRISGQDGGILTFEGKNNNGTTKVIVLARAN